MAGNRPSQCGEQCPPPGVGGVEMSTYLRSEFFKKWVHYEPLAVRTQSADLRMCDAMANSCPFQTDQMGSDRSPSSAALQA